MGLVLPTNSDVNNIITPNGTAVVPGTIIYDSTNDCIRFFKRSNEWSNCIRLSPNAFAKTKMPTNKKQKNNKG